MEAIGASHRQTMRTLRKKSDHRRVILCTIRLTSTGDFG
jgi:hypothetical protein